ncbi:ABC transporter permease [Nocardiopsis exhalans]|uniref:ABC-2 type transport system permease protein n=2 Tax=Nocardiopsis TaxID=2013 RepID=A0A840WBF0_9ACTN|nr:MULTISPECIES: ABC transporter permease [Nocardiopsis]MBB5494319.1 ABC-2 type transport system permease protein [Nocardiopsis metallicus]USY20639.1 ABC transporter permease [Nocardiopsis exhalans]
MNTRSTPAGPNSTTTGPVTAAAPPLSATRELLGLHTREFLRDRRNFLPALILPLALGALFLAIAHTIPEAETGAGLTFGQMIVPMLLLLTMTSAPLTATASPLATLRAQGSLRLLGTTPVGRTRFLLTHMPVRLGLVAVQLVVLVTAGTTLGHIAPADIPALFGVSVLGLLMFGAAGYLIGGVAGGTDSAQNTSLFVQMVSIMLSFMFLPMGMLPDSLAKAVSYLPPSFLADLFLSLTPGWEQLHPTWLSVLVVLGTAAVLTALAVRLFRWDQGER